MKFSQKECQKLSDEDLVRESLKNIEYFACLFERYEQKLLRYILRISYFSQEEADDVLQESFIKIWKNLNKFDSSLKFSSWAYRIVHNTTISEWKKTKSHGKDKQIRINEDIFKNLPSKLNLAEQLHKKNNLAEIRKILDSLPKKYSEVLILKFLEDRNYREISDILKKPPGTIATLIHRAKKVFHKKITSKNISFDL